MWHQVIDKWRQGITVWYHVFDVWRHDILCDVNVTLTYWHVTSNNIRIKLSTNCTYHKRILDSINILYKKWNNFAILTYIHYIWCIELKQQKLSRKAVSLQITNITNLIRVLPIWMIIIIINYPTFKKQLFIILQTHYQRSNCIYYSLSLLIFVPKHISVTEQLNHVNNLNNLYKEWYIYIRVFMF